MTTLLYARQSGWPPVPLGGEEEAAPMAQEVLDEIACTKLGTVDEMACMEAWEGRRKGVRVALGCGGEKGSEVQG